MTRSEAIYHLYAVFDTHPLYDINLVKLNHILDEVEAHEREACAALFDDHNIWDEEVAAAIRARSKV